MNYIQHQINVQPVSTNNFNNHLHIPSLLTGFTNTNTHTKKTRSNRTVYCFEGQLDINETDRICECGCKTHKNGTGYPVTIRHLSFGDNLTDIQLFSHQFVCSNPKCNKLNMQSIPFKAENHLLLTSLNNTQRIFYLITAIP